MHIKRRNKIFVSLGIAAIALTPLIAAAIDSPIGAKDFPEVVKRIGGFIQKLLIPVSVIIILYAAFLYMTAGGSEEKVKKAHKALLWAFVGIGIVLIGSGFIDIIKDVLGVKGS